MNKRDQLENELKALHEDMTELYDIWDACMSKGTDGDGDILVSEADGIRISILLGV